MRISTIPQIYRHFNRWVEIFAVLSKYGLADWMSRFPLRFARSVMADRNGTALARHSRETRIRLALTELGPTFIKLGQILSTRPDLVGVELADELSLLQDDVPADPPEVVRSTIERELRRPLSQSVRRVRSISARLGVDRPGPPGAGTKTGSWSSSRSSTPACTTE